MSCSIIAETVAPIAGDSADFVFALLLHLHETCHGLFLYHRVAGRSLDELTASCVPGLPCRMSPTGRNQTEHPVCIAPAPPPPLRADWVAPQSGASFRASIWAPQPGTAQWGPRLGGPDPGPHSGPRSRPTFLGQDATQQQHSI